MCRRINLVLAAAASGLAGLLAWSVLRVDAVPIPPQQPVLAFQTTPKTPSRPVAAALVATALARPIVSADRRPPAPVLPARPETPPLPRLAGVTTDTGAALAFLTLPAGNTSALRPGEHLGNFVVRDIAADSVMLDGPDGLQVLHLSLDPRAVRVTSSAGQASAAMGDTQPGKVLAAEPLLAGLPAAELRAVLASAEAVELAGPEPQGCCASDLGWWRLKAGAAYHRVSW